MLLLFSTFDPADAENPNDVGEVEELGEKLEQQKIVNGTDPSAEGMAEYFIT